MRGRDRKTRSDRNSRRVYTRSANNTNCTAFVRVIVKKRKFAIAVVFTIILPNAAFHIFHCPLPDVGHYASIPKIGLLRYNFRWSAEMWYWSTTVNANCCRLPDHRRPSSPTRRVALLLTHDVDCRFHSESILVVCVSVHVHTYQNWCNYVLCLTEIKTSPIYGTVTLTCHVPRTWSKAGDQAFAVAWPNAWNLRSV
jgi:hypothetical protein